MGPHRIDDTWREEHLLGDGRRVVLRTIRPGDREMLRRGFEELSPASRYLRFFTTKAQLTDAELRQLTHVDNVDHLALGAVELGPEGTEGGGLGVARFARLPDEPTAAEPAVAVVDRFQGRGLGTLLLARLAEAARERGIEVFRCEILAVNQSVLHLLRQHAPRASLQASGDVVRVEARVPRVGVEDGWEAVRESTAYRILTHAAGGGRRVGLSRLLLKERPSRPEGGS